MIENYSLAQVIFNSIFWLSYDKNEERKFYFELMQKLYELWNCDFQNDLVLQMYSAHTI